MAIAILIYLVSSRLLSMFGGRVSSYLPLVLSAVPIFLFPNLRVHSTMWDRAAPTLAKSLLALACGASAFSVVEAVRKMGLGRAAVSSSVSFGVGAALSSIVLPFSLELASPWVLLTLYAGSSILALSAVVE